jgi:hypothetical protein
VIAVAPASRAPTLVAEGEDGRNTVRIKWALIRPRHHLRMYDGPSLSKLVSDAGFVDVMIMPAGKTNISDLWGALTFEERANESVYVEAAQPE